MCGIGGILGYRTDARVALEDAVRLRDAMTHRGPDDAGLWQSDDGATALVHRRLSIIDLSERGHQPMLSADGRYCVVFNGEIYNFRALRNELEAVGLRFQSDSDTEVVLQGYRQWGREVLDRLRGMFAFAIHDIETRETVLARDPLGIKPLYWLDDGNRLFFASETAAIRSIVDPGELDPEGVIAFLQWGSIPAPRTLHRRIHSLPPGAWLRVGDRRLEGPRAYYRLEKEIAGQPGVAPAEAESFAREALLDSVRHHLVADVTVGAFLSGGVDSPALVGLLAEVHGGAVETVNMSFDVAALDESALARAAADRYGANHHCVRVRIDDIRERMPQTIRELDQPTLDGVNVYFVSEAAVAAGLKVAVSGVGGDELFGGYASFQRVPRIRAMRRWVGPLGGPIAGLAGRLRRAPAGARAAAKLEMAFRYGRSYAGAYLSEKALFSHGELRALLAPDLHEALAAWDPVAELEARVPLGDVPREDRVSVLEIGQYLQMQLLRDADAASMKHSLELRTPLVDRDLLRAIFRIPAETRLAGPAKRLLRNAPRPPLPDEFWNRQKQGFTFPFESWLREGKLDLPLPRHPWLDPRGVAGVEEAFRAGKVHWSRLWVLLVLGCFLD